MSAIYAHRVDPKLKVVVLDKSKMETSGGAGRGMDALNTVALPPYSQPEDVVELLTKVTEGVLDQDVAYRFGEVCPRMVADLEQIMDRGKGDLFPVDEDGNYQLLYLHPINKPLLLPMDGEEMKRALAHAVRETGAEVMDRTPALKIITSDGKVCGVLAVNIRTGHYYYIKTKAVCLTTGAAGRMGLSSSGYLAGTYEFPGCSGDGYTMAYEAGAELVNMECFQANTLLKDHQGPSCGYVAAPRGAYTINPWEQRTWSHGYSSGDSKMGSWKRFAQGKGPIYLKMDHLPEEMIQIIEKIQWGNERTSRGLFHHGRQQDYRNANAVELAFAEEIGVCGGHSSSGVLSDVDGATCVPGLYVAGDVDGGLPHSYLGGALAMGGIIGEAAAHFAAGVPEPAQRSGLKAWLRKEAEEFEAPLRREGGLPTTLVEYKARTRVQYYLKPPKNPVFMEKAAWWMERIRQEDLPQIQAVDMHDLLKAHEIKSILRVGEMMARSSLFRDESRWGYQHWRTDLPAKKPEWDRAWVVIKKGPEGGMELEKRPVPGYKWDYPTAMEYAYPDLEFDTGPMFEKGPEWKNPTDDPWMKKHLDAQGMATPRLFMPKEED
ncbi:MAG: FAD-binding protein [Desulfarculaceae bacterium]|nr:FAD-binding protein [Desulfarculaceae bacterium]MCF8073184.1 FAD-binding protein [Desulfarculaceae bacterium]MCF8100780.1 FAD-binding protein [Desulfarculaceae bacterium]MCF8118427.1 FAD-binding protein [Desulfarculaceae bacterium]